MKKLRIPAEIYVLFSALTWSLIGLITKHIHWSGLTIGLVRGMAAGIVMVALLHHRPAKPSKLQVLTAVCYLGQGVLFVMANKYTTAANATMLQNTSPLYIMLFTAIVNRKLPRVRDVVTCLILLCGIGLAMYGSLGTGGMLGNVFALLSALFYAGVYFCSCRPGVDTAEATMEGNLACFLALPFLISAGSFAGSAAEDWIFIAILGADAALGWWFFAKGVRGTGSLKAGFIAMVEPISAPIWTLVFLHEVPGLFSVLGFFVVILTLLIYNWLNLREARARAE